ncbi:SDR family oxidoreductase [Natronococcus sp. A-GB7]|uniref:SDR family oxidoreductase n=1 Tax=Natronococcus sp. A-GB7 TaxID=3037649 RepID=UPI00241FE05C|nr:SDR family oxidoreductase [Natronococcus sp. A-GB7]MDG5820536.1 SDR family oxidoreductase [Natronococcus sp. A-GB7]
MFVPDLSERIPATGSAESELRGTFPVTRFDIDRTLERGSGRVIDVASQLGIKGAAELTHYSAAKSGGISFTRALAREVPPDVQVGAIAPGPIETDMLDDTTEEWRERREAEVLLGRIGAVDDAVQTAVLLAGDGGDYSTGQTLSPDGRDAMHRRESIHDTSSAERLEDETTDTPTQPSVPGSRSFVGGNSPCFSRTGLSESNTPSESSRNRAASGFGGVIDGVTPSLYNISYLCLQT